MATDDQDELQPPSKSQRKREALAQQELGEKLTELTQSKLARLDLPGQLHTAVDQFKRLPNSRGARKRQLQYIGRLMREIDCATIEANLATLTKPPKAATDNSASKNLEEIGSLVLAQGDPAITALLEQYPQLERQPLRQLYRSHCRADPDQAESIRKRLLNYLAETLAA